MPAPNGSPQAASGDQSLAAGRRSRSNWTPYLARIPLFQGVSRSHLKTIATLTDLRWYADRQALVRAGAPSDAFRVILEGRAEAEPPFGDVRVFEPGESFGELSLIDGAPTDAQSSRTGAPRWRASREPSSVGSCATNRRLPGARAEPRRRDPRLRGRRPAGGFPVAADSRLRRALRGSAVARRRAALREPVAAPPAQTGGRGRSETVRGWLDRGSPGCPGDVFQVIDEGQGEAITPDGVGHRLSRGDWFDELALLDGAPSKVTITAVGELVTPCIGRADFLKLSHEEPTIAVASVRRIVALIRDFERPDAS
jgi:CRP-like cAMP-binding protein